jgi:hypothetical protein
MADAKADELWGCGAPTIARRLAMTHYDTQQQYLNNPQQWAQTAQPYGAWLNMSSPQATGGFGLGQGAYGQQYGQYGGQPSIGAFGYNPVWGMQPQAQAWGNCSNLSGAVSNSASFRNRT